MSQDLYSSLGLKRAGSVDQSQIDAVELALGVSLPVAYLDLVRFNDEPTPAVSIVGYDGGETSVSEFLRFSDDAGDEFGLLAYAPATRGGPKRFVPFARDAGDWLFCFDVDADNAIVLFDPFALQSFRVAPSFEEFLRALRE